MVSRGRRSHGRGVFVAVEDAASGEGLDVPAVGPCHRVTPFFCFVVTAAGVAPALSDGGCGAWVSRSLLVFRSLVHAHLPWCGHEKRPGHMGQVFRQAL